MENTDDRKTIKVPQATHYKVKLAASLANENIPELLDRLAAAEIAARAPGGARLNGKAKKRNGAK